MVKKLKIYNNFQVPNNFKHSILLIGNFDGIHLGHKKLFNLAKKYKKKFNLKVGVITFEPVPKMYFNKNLKNFRISNLRQKIENLKKLNIDFLIVKKFDKKFSKIKYQNFVYQILYKKLKASFIFVSNNFRFGNKREGNVKFLKSKQKKYNYKIINPKPLKKKSKIISSTLIRKLIFNGKLGIANKYLSRNWSIEGIVQTGRKMGRKIGFPTCNIELGNYIDAKSGVYAVKVYRENKKNFLRGIANIGYRPTFNQRNKILEVNLFNFSGNLYNKKLRVEFTKFIRKEIKFNGIEQLRKQIILDLKIAKKLNKH